MHLKNDVVIDSWPELQETLFLDTWNEDRRRFISPFSYRGVVNKDWRLETSFSRLDNTHEPNELHILRNFKKYARQHTTNDKNEWEWLSIAQHHGLATRLLDWSFSPLVALHFAVSTYEYIDNDAAIWCVNRPKCNEKLPSFIRTSLEELHNPLVFDCHQLEKIAIDLSSLDAISENDRFVIFLEPPVLDERISNQYAHFSLMNSRSMHLDEWLKNHEDVFFRIVIPASLKWQIRDRLDQFNITERLLFPGLDGLSRWLNRHYTQRP
jgi:hypothetical protein